MIRDPRAQEKPFRPSPSRQDILRDFEKLIAERKLFGAELDPTILKKSGKGTHFLISEVPSRAKLLRRWANIFGNVIPPCALFEALSTRTHEFEHRENLLLFGKERIVYDTQIFQGEERVGELTLSFASVIDPMLGVLALLKGARLKVVYIEHIRLTAQRSGYASTLFRHYERLFRDLGFNEFRLSASLSVGRYYWAQEGFDFSDKSEIGRRKAELRTLVKKRSLPVREIEIGRLNHAYDFARFKRDVRIPVYRDAQGFYSLSSNDRFREEVSLPLGKAFLLSGAPWEGYKTIYTNTPRRTGFVASSDYLAHRTRAGHVENPKRLRILRRAVEKHGLKSSLVYLEPYVPDQEFLEGIHRADYLARFRESVRKGEKAFSTRDCSICPASFDVALLAAGGVMAGVDAVLNERVDNVFCAVRPPGHHAGRNAAMGFCFINNIAVGAVYARTVYGVERIFILDWDVHHGNGTQEIFEEDPLTYYCSIHEHPTFCFPGTGRRMERGTGAGTGFTLNLPLKPHARDQELMESFEKEVVPEIERVEPGLIMISAGFDAHERDSIADLDLTEKSFAYMTRRICELAARLCEGRIVSVLEGGYDGPSLASSAVAHLETLQGRSRECSSERE
ncbi:MAG TPA: histone deacetylase [Thermoanaerobaculia bacterium]|nr:histone deacetylase [Thermoanaerobaculia bacterium]